MIETCAHCIRDIIQQTDLELTDLLDKRENPLFVVHHDLRLVLAGHVYAPVCKFDETLLYAPPLYLFKCVNFRGHMKGRKHFISFVSILIL
jgi:hypothetical protein